MDDADTAEAVREGHREAMVSLADYVSEMTTGLHQAMMQRDAAVSALGAALRLVEAQSGLLDLLSAGQKIGSRAPEAVPDETDGDVGRKLRVAPDPEDMEAIEQSMAAVEGATVNWPPRDDRADRLREEMRAVQGSLKTLLGGVGLWRDSAMRGGLKGVLRALDAVLTRDEREAGL
jgi:hypothetical protein